jgi:hypothetical protein
MTENEYAKVTNRVKISTALVILRGTVLPEKGDEYGITNDELVEIKRLLRKAEKTLLGSPKITES